MPIEMDSRSRVHDLRVAIKHHLRPRLDGLSVIELYLLKVTNSEAEDGTSTLYCPSLPEDEGALAKVIGKLDFDAVDPLDPLRELSHVFPVVPPIRLHVIVCTRLLPGELSGAKFQCPPGISLIGPEPCTWQCHNFTNAGRRKSNIQHCHVDRTMVKQWHAT